MRYSALLSFILCVAELMPSCIIGRTPEQGSMMWQQQKLYTELLTDYMPSVRPAVNASYSIPIRITSFIYGSVNDLEEQEQIMSSVVFLRLLWQDIRLVWNPKDYGNIDEVEIPVNQLWYPDIYVDNAKDSKNPVTAHQLAIVRYDGSVRWEQVMHLRTFCHMDLEHFPYDSHNCSVYLSLWAYHKQKAHLIVDRRNENYTRISCVYTTAHDWRATSCGMGQLEYQYETGNDGSSVAFPIIGYWLNLQRQSSFTSHLFVAPSVALCLITPVIFLLPPASKEKMIFGVGILLSDVILLGELIRFIPTAYPSVPLIGKYILSNIVLCCMALLISACIINIWGRRSTHVSSPPHIIVKIFLGPVARMLLVTPDQFLESLQDDGADQKEQVTMTNTPQGTNLQLPLDEAGRARQRQAQTHVRIARLQWHQLAVVIDRIFVILYPVVLVCLTFLFAQYM